MIEWWNMNWAAIKDLMFYGFWLGCGAMGALFGFGLFAEIIKRLRAAVDK